MTANQLQIDAATRTIKAIFDDELQLVGEGALLQLAMRTRSKAKTVDYHFLHSFDEMREWVGPRKVADFKAESFTIPNITYESSVHVDRVDVESDSIGLYEPKVRNMPQAYNRKRRRMIAALITSGHNAANKSYDGVSFFNAAHPNDDGTTQRNYRTGFSLTGENFDAVVQEMQEYKDHRGEPLDITPTHIVVGPKLRATARNLFQVTTDFAGSNPDAAAVTSNAGSNPYFGAVTVIVDPYITDESWTVVDTSKALKPFVLQDADDLEMQVIDSNDAEYVINNDGYFYGTRARWGVGYGFWQLAFKSVQ